MITECPKCHKVYNDDARWTICPHYRLEATPDGKGYCEEHDLFNCQLPHHTEGFNAGVHATSNEEGTGAQSGPQEAAGGDEVQPAGEEQQHREDGVASGQSVRRPSADVVREFHEAFGHPIGDAPNMGTPLLRMLRVRLIAEELKELADASGIMVEITVGGFTGQQPNLLEMADALIDLDYVVSGAMVCYGIDQYAGMLEVHRSNMSKLGADGKPICREDGKVLKGPNYFRPDLALALKLP